MKIHLSSYKKSWKQDFVNLKEILSKAISHLNNDSFSIQIEHIGSTSVEGLLAKPIIDILIGVEKEADLDNLIKPFQEIGFTWNSTWDDTLPFRRLFHQLSPLDKSLPIPKQVTKPPKGDLRATYHITTNIHCVPINSDWWNDHLLFRNYLRANEEARQKYQAEKMLLSLREWESVPDYAGAKTRIIDELKEEAKIWENL